MTATTLHPDVALRGQHFIGGEVPGGGPEQAVPHVYPVTGEPIASVSIASAAEVDRAVRSAADAFPAWRDLNPTVRRALLVRLADLIAANKHEFDVLNAYEMGVPLSRGSAAPLTALWFHYYAGWIDKLDGHVPPLATAAGFGYTRLEPYGVIAAIVPFNGALIDVGLKVAPALAAGNTVVIKPSELAPFSPVRFAELAIEAGLPAGVVNVVQGAGETGDALVRHHLVKKVSFTGGGPTAAKILAAVAPSLKPVVTELGGKSANIIFPDADLDEAIAFSCHFPLAVNAGQNCQKPSRLFIHDSIYDEAIDRLVATAESFVLGDPFDLATTMGPVISERAVEHATGMVRQAVERHEGRLVTGGARIGGELKTGYFVQPTIVADVQNSTPLAQEEIFAPVLAVLRFRTEDEVVAMANDTDFGLASYIQTRDLGTAHRVAARLEAGMVNVNGFYNANPGSPFGGYKQSGSGREGGRWGIDEFLQVKNVFMKI
jgi:acyl-CoA reductase-like NAD-dependent aldehyde dehydrogenase